MSTPLRFGLSTPARKLKGAEAALLITLGLAAITGCSPAARSPDAIRQDSAAVTAAAARDAKAVAQGVFDGLKAKGPLNINKATQQELQTLPGIDPAAAQRIISARPYESSVELVRRHVLSKRTYDKIANRVVAH